MLSKFIHDYYLINLFYKYREIHIKFRKKSQKLIAFFVVHLKIFLTKI